MIGQTAWDVEHPNPTDLNSDLGSIRVGRITRVYDAEFAKSASSSEKTLYGKADVLWLDGVSRVPKPVDVCRSWFSWKRGAGIFFMPEVDDIVVCQSRNNGYPVIVGFLPYKWDSSLGTVAKTEDFSVGPIKPLNKGEVLIKASSQAEIHLNNNGTIKLRAKDSSNTENVTSNLEQNCTEEYFSRVREDNTSTVAETTIGYTETFDGAPKSCGSSLQVFESAAVNYEESSLTFYVSDPNENSVSFFLTNDTEISDISSVSIIGGTEKNKTVTNLIPSQYLLNSEIQYLPFDASSTSLYFKPCTIEKNVIKYTLTIRNFKLSAGQTIVLTVLFRKVNGAIRLNSEGDLFLDGRNVIIRSKNELATLSLDSLGKAKLRGVNTTLGNTCGGQVLIGETGVDVYGKLSSDPAASQKEASVGNTKYFYIEETLPLIKKYFVPNGSKFIGLFGDNGSWTIDGVTTEDYQKMSIEDKNSVNKATLSQIQDTSTINSDTLKRILEGDFPSYAELKAGE